MYYSEREQQQGLYRGLFPANPIVTFSMVSTVKYSYPNQEHGWKHYIVTTFLNPIAARLIKTFALFSIYINLLLSSAVQKKSLMTGI